MVSKAKRERRYAKRKLREGKAAPIREMLVERFPLAFMPKGADKKPLKVGIYQDIRAAMPELSGVKIAMALYDYTIGFKYRSALIAGVERIDLAGEPCGVVTEDQICRRPRPDLRAEAIAPI